MIAFAIISLFVFTIGVMNMLGGRFEDIDPSFPLGGRLVFRCLLPGMGSGAFALGYGFVWWQAIGIAACVMGGSGLWYMPGWSFDEITGVYSPTKYPAFLRRFGLWLVPDINTPSRNRLRGIILKSIRGTYDALTYTSLFFVNHSAPLYIIGTLFMGPTYWLSGRISASTNAVRNAEFFYGCIRGLLIGLAITYNIAGL